MRKTLIAVAIATAATSTPYAGANEVKGPFSFVPQLVSGLSGAEDPCSPMTLPEGFSQTILVSETDACGTEHTVLDAVSGEQDKRDMNTVNETGRQRGRFVYTTHENGGGAAALSVLDSRTGKAQIYRAADFGISPAWSRLDGIEWTPWGTALIAEENGPGGRLFECDVDGLKVNDCVDRPAVGRMSHEGIAVDGNGDLYVADELNGGSIYKFVALEYGDLSKGTLYALDIEGSVTVCSSDSGVGVTPLGHAQWVALSVGENGVKTSPSVDARAASDEAGVSDFCRPEDAEIIGPNLYFATTTTRNILQIPLNTDFPYVTEYAGINTNMDNEADFPEYGLKSPDNLASDNAGNLYIVEDNSSHSDVWVATPDKNNDGKADSVVLFGTLTTPGAEGSGIYFPRGNPKTMLINVQHAADNNDMTLAITKD